MTRRVELFLLIVVDGLMVNVALAAYFWLRIRGAVLEYPIDPALLMPMVGIFLYWLAVFALFGLYHSWYHGSRIDEVVVLFRASFVGMLVLFFLVFFDDKDFGLPATSRSYILVYWITLLGTVAIGRLSIRFLQRQLLLAGIGAQRTIIVGLADQAQKLLNMTEEYPALGYEVVGFVSTNDRLKRNDAKTNLKHRPLLGSIGELPSIIERHHVQQVLIGLDSAQHDQLLDVISFCNGHDVRMKILPDLYNIVSGQARINSIFGQELMEVHPQIMKPWEEVAKRTVDLVVSAIVLLVTLPFLFLIGLAVLVDSRRPILYRQDRVGKNGRQFNMLKFRSMLQDAEEQSGPTWAEKDDPRATKVGRFLRRTHLDEVPQFYNVLVGDMSLVGPRPERKYFSDQFAKEIPLYRHRLRVRPGITGWAQIKYQYDQSIDDVKSKLRQDLFYIENMSWQLDLKILLNTLYVMVRGKGHT